MKNLLLAAMLTLCADVALAADEIHYTVLGQTEVGFSWRGGIAPAVEYGTEPGVYTGSVLGVTPVPLPFSSVGPFWEARIAGLTENTRYYYRIDGGAEHAFKTPPPRGSAGFWFGEEADIGDTGQDRTTPGSGYRVGATQAALASDESPDGYDVPDFILAVGDLSYANSTGHGQAACDQHFNDVMVWSQEAAYMPAWGNHEWDSPATDDLRNYEGRFILPGVTRSAAGWDSTVAPGSAIAGPYDDWSWFDYGCVRFISYPEPYAGTSFTWNPWTQSADSLMDAVDSDPAIRYVVTFGHRPAWSNGDHTGSSTLKSRINQLRNGGTLNGQAIGPHPKYVLNINGHSHNYERFNPALTNGVLNITGAGGGAACEPSCHDNLNCIGDTAASVVYLNELVHLKVFVAADAIYGYAICGPSGAASCTSACTAGTVVDSWTIPTLTTTGVAETISRPRPMPQGWFDLQGRRLRQVPSRRGIYLHDGRVVRIL
jgi:calcineurin-like phosphoesterase family protein